MKLIDNWKRAYKYLSVQATALLALVATAYEYLPAVREYLPEGWVKYAALVIIVARVIQQVDPSPNKDV